MPLAWRLGVLILSFTWLAGCSSLPSPLYDPAPLPSFTTQAKLKNLWSDTSGYGERWRGYELTPALAANLLVAADSQGWVQAFDLNSTGFLKSDLIWSQQLEQGVSAGLTISGNQLFIATQGGALLALNIYNGAFIWQAQLPSEALSAPQVLGSRLVIQTTDGSVLAFDAMSGRQLWRYSSALPPLTLRGTSSPKITSLQTFIGLASGRLVSVDNASGQVRWEATIAQPEGRTDIERLVDVRGQAQEAYGMLVVNSFQGQTQALDPFTGNSRWARKISSYWAPVIFNEQVLVVDEASRIHALDLFSGTSLWMQDKLYGRDLGQPVILDNTLVTADYQGYVHLLDAATGEIIGRKSFDPDGISAPLLVNEGRLLIHSTRGRLGLFELKK